MNAPDDDLLWLYLDGELGAREHALVEKALAQDPLWQARFQVLQAEDEVLRSAVLESKLGGIAERLAEKLRHQIRNDTNNPDGSDSELPDKDPV